MSTPPYRLTAVRHVPVGVRDLRHVRDRVRRLLPADLLDDVDEHLLAAADDEDLGALGREQPRDRRPDARPAAGDHRDLARQPVYAVLASSGAPRGSWTPAVAVR
jgi:hypothetical protein